MPLTPGTGQILHAFRSGEGTASFTMPAFRFLPNAGDLPSPPSQCPFIVPAAAPPNGSGFAIAAAAQPNSGVWLNMTIAAALLASGAPLTFRAQVSAPLTIGVIAMDGGQVEIGAGGLTVPNDTIVTIFQAVGPRLDGKGQTAPDVLLEWIDFSISRSSLGYLTLVNPFTCFDGSTMDASGAVADERLSLHDSGSAQFSGAPGTIVDLFPWNDFGTLAAPAPLQPYLGPEGSISPWPIGFAGGGGFGASVSLVFMLSNQDGSSGSSTGLINDIVWTGNPATPPILATPDGPQPMPSAPPILGPGLPTPLPSPVPTPLPCVPSCNMTDAPLIGSSLNDLDPALASFGLLLETLAGPNNPIERT